MKDPMVKMTEPEMAAMQTAMQQFGTCTCSPRGVWPPKQCDGHRFLVEEDHKVGRVERMLYVRRTREQWIARENHGKCKVCGLPGEHEPGADRCKQCAVLNTNAELATLPW